MALHPHYFGRAIKNGSSQYDYQRWNQESRFNAAKHVKIDTRVQPHAEEPIELDPEIRLVCPVGGAYQFSAAQLHSTVPNTSAVTRYSIDFRTVHVDDLVGRVEPTMLTLRVPARPWETTSGEPIWSISRKT